MLFYTVYDCATGSIKVELPKTSFIIVNSIYAYENPVFSRPS